MSEQIIDLQDWFQTAPGQYLLDWERRQVDAAVADMFGYHALQLGVPQLEGLRDNRMPHRWLATEAPVSRELDSHCRGVLFTPIFRPCHFRRKAWIWCCCHTR